MQIVITTRLSHPMPFVPTQTVWACELSIYGLLALAALADLAQRQGNLLKESCVEHSRRPSVVFDLQRTSDCAVLLCTRKRHKGRERGVSQDPKCFSPVWAKVLADGRPFGSQKESDSSNSERDTRVNHSFIHSFNQPINQSFNQPIPSGPGAFQRQTRGPRD